MLLSSSESKRLVTSAINSGPSYSLLLLLAVCQVTIWLQFLSLLFSFLKIFSIFLILLYISYITYIHILYNISIVIYNLYNKTHIFKTCKIHRKCNCYKTVTTVYLSVFPLYTLVKYKLRGPHSPANNLCILDIVSIIRPSDRYTSLTNKLERS